MFRISSRIQDEMGAGHQQIHTASPRESGWKPALRRLKKGLFTKGKQDTLEFKELKESPRIEYVFPRHPAIPTRTPSPAEVAKLHLQQPPNTTSKSEKLRPRGPREPPKGFSLFSRFHSKKNGSEAENLIEESDACPYPEPISKERRPPQATRPKTANNEPSPSNNIHSTELNPRCQPSAPAPRPRSAYIPQHAASDFSRMNLETKDPTSPYRQHRTSFQHALSSNPIQTPKPDKSPPTAEDHASDYQRFLLESQLKASPASKTQPTNYRSFRTKPETSQVARVMDNLTAAHHENNNLRRQRSVSRSSIQSRRSSLMEKVGEYIKPSRPESVYSQRGRGVERGSVDFGDGDRAGRRWSRVGGEVRRSFSRGRDCEGRGRSGGIGSGLKMGKEIPVSPALNKYNRVVGTYGT